MRFVFPPPAGDAADLLTLPWARSLSAWDDARLVEVPGRGLSRHVVRFVVGEHGVCAVKELDERLARREYRVLRRLADLGVPAVEGLGVVVDRGPGVEAALVTRFLAFSTSYRSAFTRGRGGPPAELLLDALVTLLVRLHLAGLFWGDCSLSNTLFRLDAGAYAAYLVDAETSELQPGLSDGQRRHDLVIAEERVGGELLDLHAAGLLPEEIEPGEVAAEVVPRYERLWDEVTREEELTPGAGSAGILARVRRLNQLGFGVEELELHGDDRLWLRTRVEELGHNRRTLARRTGLEVEENQARRLLADIDRYRGELQLRGDQPVSPSRAALTWLVEVYEPVVDAIPAELRGRLHPAEVFHEVLEHRWFLSERQGHDVGMAAAARSYFSSELPRVPVQDPLGGLADAPPGAPPGAPPDPPSGPPPGAPPGPPPGSGLQAPPERGAPRIGG